MSQALYDRYEAIISVVKAELASFGFTSGKGQEFLRSRGKVSQRFAISLRERAGEEMGFVETFPGFIFPEVEKFASSLRNKKPRPGFLTCSLNIGLAQPNGSFLEWPLSSRETPRLFRWQFRRLSVRKPFPFGTNFSQSKVFARGTNPETLAYVQGANGGGAN